MIQKNQWIYTLLNCAYAVQRYTLEELTDKTEKDHLDIPSLLTMMEQIQKYHATRN